MFNNIGKKIKGVAVAITCLGIIGSLIWGIISYVVSPLLCIVIIVAGSLAAWLGSFLLYGFGHLIDVTETSAYYAKHSFNKLHNIDEQLEKIAKKLNNENC